MNTDEHGCFIWHKDSLEPPSDKPKKFLSEKNYLCASPVHLWTIFPTDLLPGLRRQKKKKKTYCQISRQYVKLKVALFPQTIQTFLFSYFSYNSGALNYPAQDGSSSPKVRKLPLVSDQTS